MTPTQTPSPMPSHQPTTKANMVAQFIESIHEVGLELAAWRAFGADVVGFLKERGISEEFETWRKAQRALTAKPKRRR